jgi:hypothetical protein
VKVIDYDATFREISIRVHIMEVMTAPLTISETVYSSKLCRINFMFHNLRLGAYNTLVVGGQYTNRLVLLGLLVVELSKIASSIYLYVTFKHLRKLIILLTDVSQSLFLSVFLVIALIICPAETNDDVPDNLQTSGMWTVIISCMSEYLLLIIYIVITVHDMLRLRKATKTLPKRTNSIIKYRYEKIMPIVSNEETLQEYLKPKKLARKPRADNRVKRLVPGNHIPSDQQLILAHGMKVNMQQNSLSKVKNILNKLKQTPGDGERSNKKELTLAQKEPSNEKSKQVSNAQAGGYTSLWEQMAKNGLTIPGLKTKSRYVNKKILTGNLLKKQKPGARSIKKIVRKDENTGNILYL